MSNGAIRGFRQDDDRAWKRFKGWMKSLGAGEFFTLSYTRPRNPKLHRKFFAMLRHAFDHWEPRALTHNGQPVAKNFEAFREQVLILAGHYEQTFALDGTVQLRAKSIRFDKLDDDDEFARIYESVLLVLLEHVLTNYKRDDLDRVVAELEAFGT